jgi:peptidoglycan/LPS O-acetylase OafA/YrhL
MLYGHLAVVVFIVLSGFSLALAPARHGWHVGSLRTYAHRRAWRILSAYWPALVVSLVVATWVVPQPGEGTPTMRTVLVYGLLLQDVVGAPSPNGAFWSIAIEAQLYLLLPLLIVVCRRRGPWTMIAVVLAPILVIGILAPIYPVVDLFSRFTPQMAVGFAVGVGAVAIATSAAPSAARFVRLAALTALPILVVLATVGSVWSIEHYFWVDLAVVVPVALLLMGLRNGDAPWLGRLLDARPVRSLGSYSYSLYLVHAPVVVAFSTLLVAPLLGSGLDALATMLLVALPVSLLWARLFAALFDLPFQRHKSWAALGHAAQSRIGRPWRPKDGPNAQNWGHGAR